MSSFQDLGFFPEAEAKWSYAYALSQSYNSTPHARNSFGLLPQDYCER